MVNALKISSIINISRYKSCYCISLKRLEPEPLLFENIANHSALFIKNPNQGRISNTFLTRIFCGI